MLQRFDIITAQSRNTPNRLKAKLKQQRRIKISQQREVIWLSHESFKNFIDLSILQRNSSFSSQEECPSYGCRGSVENEKMHEIDQNPTYLDAICTLHM
jgi:hypothetical protein